ncbi:MAG: efflux RND transporter periplasmic adaptor subunit [Planctomycetales bacterium]
MNHQGIVRGILLGTMLLWAAAAGWATAKDGPEKGDTSAKSGATGTSGKPIEIPNCTINFIREVTLAFDRPGIVEFTVPQEGTEVKEGDPVARLQDEVARAALAITTKETESDVDIRYAEKSSQLAETEHTRMNDANRQNPKTFPLIDILKVKLAWDKAVLEMEAATHRHDVNLLKRDEAQAQLNTYQIKAPFGGVVTRIHRYQGEAVRQGDQVLELVNTRLLRVEGAVSLREARQLRRELVASQKEDEPATPVLVELVVEGEGPNDPPQTLEGELKFVGLKSESTDKEVRVWAEVRNPDEVLCAGLRGTLKIYPRGQGPANRTASQ